MKHARDEALESQAPRVAERRRAKLEARYDHWIKKGRQVHPAVGKTRVEQGRAKQSAGHNLFMRLSDQKDDVLGFLREIELASDNNQAKRNLHMIKAQQKIGGLFSH